MAAQFDVARVFYQPQGAEPVQDLSRGLERNAAQLFQFGQQAFQQANAHFDRALATYNDMAVENAQKDAAGIVSRDGEGVITAPSTFYPSGLHSGAYTQAYRKAAIATYRENALSDFGNYTEAQKALYPTDPEALKKVLDERRVRMVTGLAEDQKGFIDITLQQATSKALTQVGVNLQAATNKANLEQADITHAAIVDDAMRNTADWSKLDGLTGEASIKAAGELVLANSVLKERWDGLEAMWKRAGIGQPQIDRFRAELGYQVILKRQSESLKGVRFEPDKQGRIDQAQIRDKQDQIHAYAEQFPGRSAQIEQVLNRSLDYAVTQSQRTAASVALADQKSVEPMMREFYRLGHAARLAPNNSDEQRRILDDLNTKGMAILNDPRLSDGAAMRGAAAAFGAGGMALSSLQESYSNRLQGLGNIINATGSTVTVQQKEQAYQAALQIQQDPEINRHMTTAQRGYVQQLIDKVAYNKLASDHAGLVFEAEQGRTEPSAYQAMLKRNVASGMYGDQPGAVANMAVVQAMAAKQEAAWNKRIAAQVGARDALQAAAEGRPLTDTMVQAVKDTMPFKLPGQEKAADWSNPGNAPASLPSQTLDVKNQQHVDRAIDYARLTGIVPDEMKAAMGAMPRSPQPEDMAPYIGVYQQMYQVAAERYHRLTGQKADDNQLRVMVGSMIGEQESTYLAAAQRFGTDAAFKLNLGGASKTSVTGSLGQPTDEATKSMVTAAENFLGNLVNGSRTSTWAGKLAGIRLPFTAGWRETEAERAANAVLYASPDVKPSLVGNLFAKTPSFSGGIKWEGQAAAFIAGMANAYLATDGPAIAAVIKGETGQDYAFRAMAEKYASILEIRSSDDGATGVVGFKSFAKDQGERAGVDKLSREQEQGALSAIVLAQSRTTPGMVASWDPQSITAMPLMDGAQKSWFIAAKDKVTGAPLALMTLSDNDPRLQAHSNAALSVVQDRLRNTLRDDQGKPLPQGELDRIVGAFQTTLMAPFKGGMTADTMGSGRADFVAEVDRRLEELNRVAGVTSAPNWKKAMREIERDQTPDDGRFGLVKNLIRQYNQATAPEASIVPAR